MNCLKKTICAFLTLRVLLAPSITLASDHPAIAVLLDEKGEPFCKITDGSNDFPASELDALKECGEEILAELQEEIHMAGVPSPGKISGPALLAAGKIWAKAHGPVVVILTLADVCAEEKKHPARPLFFLGYAGSVIFHAIKLMRLQAEFGMTVFFILVTPFVSEQMAYLACDGE